MKISPLAAILLGTTLLFGDASTLTRARHLQDAEDGASTDIAAANTNKNNSGGGTICNCANPFYYFIIDTKNKISYQQAILKTPAKCILAPIPSVTVLQEIQTYVPPGLFWVGITRSAQNAVSIGNTLTQRANWNNLDGTAGPVATSGTTFTSIDSIWAGGEPNSGDTVAYFSNKNPYGLVGTTKVDNSVDGAIYKCCIDFCSDQSVSNQLGLSEIFSMN